MKKTFISLAIGLFSAISVLGAPQFKEINNFNGKTTIKIEISDSERDAFNGLSINNVKLYNNGRWFNAKRVTAIWEDKRSTIILEFKKLKYFEDCILSLTVNGEPVKIKLSNVVINLDSLAIPVP